MTTEIIGTAPWSDDGHTSVSRRTALRAVIAGGIVLGAAGSAMAAIVAAGTGQPRRGGKIKIAAQSSSTADTLDPAKAVQSIDYVRVNMFYNGLTRLDEKLMPEMVLAEDIATSDAVLWTIKLRKDVYFHDGKTMTPADVVYSLLRHRDPALGSKGASLAHQFESVKVSGPAEIQIRLIGPNADLPVILSTAPFLIVKEGTTSFRTANGTGAFRCTQFTPGMRTIGIRNPNYWKPGLPYLDEVELFGIPDEPARVNALLSGDVHWINDLNPRSVKRVKAEPGCSVLESASGMYTDLVVRQTTGIGRHPDFTLGMKYLIDREQIKRAVFRGYAVIGNDQPLAPGHPYYFAGLPQRPYDPERARFHLKKAGALDLTLPLVCSVAAAGSVEMSMLVQQSAYEVGLKLKLKRVSADGYWSNHWMKSPLGFGNVNQRPSADIHFTQFFQSGSAWNESGWNNPQFDQLLVAARGEADQAKRKQLYADMQVLVHEKCGIAIPIFITNLEGVASNIKGIVSGPLGGFMGYTAPEYVWLEV